jgi:hypothetical protein
MAFSQFDLAKVLRCSATDDEGFSCLRAPSHDGAHRWNRCETTDSDGHRCMLGLRHGGAHAMPWYDSPAVPGQMRTLRYEGSSRQTEAFSEVATRIAEAHGWQRTSQTFRPGLLWRSQRLASWTSSMATPRGRLTVIFEYRPEDR